MAMLIWTIVVELVSLTTLFVLQKNRKKRILKWILCGVTAITQFVFWYLAVKYLTIFIEFEVVLEIVAILEWIYSTVIVSTVDSEKKKKREKLWKTWILSFARILTVIMFISTSVIFCGVIAWSDETTNIVTASEISVPENLQKLKPQFCCVHNPKENKYDLYWAWNNGVYKISSYTEDECTVYRLPDSRQDLPRLETKTEHFYKYNYNFEKYEEPTLVDQKTEETYTLYICESSYKEMYTE